MHPQRNVLRLSSNKITPFLHFLTVSNKHIIRFPTECYVWVKLFSFLFRSSFSFSFDWDLFFIFFILFENKNYFDRISVFKNEPIFNFAFLLYMMKEKYIDKVRFLEERKSGDECIEKWFFGWKLEFFPVRNGHSMLNTGCSLKDPNINKQGVA